MKKTYRGRMIAYNIAIFLAIFTFILFIAVQGSIIFQINQTTASCHSHAQNALLYLREESYLTEGSFINNFKKKAGTYSKEIFEISGYRCMLLDSSGKIISDSAKNYDIDFSKIIIKINEKNKPYYTLIHSDLSDDILYVAPVSFNEQNFGYIAFTQNLDSIISPFINMLYFLLLGGLIAFPIFLLIIRRESKHFIQPIIDLTDIANQINEGNYDVNVTYLREDEIGKLTESFNTMIQNTNAAIQQLNSERDRLAAVLASLDDGLLALDKDGLVITANIRVKSFFNITNPKSIYDFQYQSFLRDIFDDLKNGKEHIYKEIESNDRDLMIIGSPIRDTGLEENYMLVIRNMTAVNRVKQEQQKFISSVSHELRTPLTTIIGYTDMILRRELSKEPIINNSLSTINKEGHRLLRLVDDLLSVNKMEAPEFSIKKTNIELQKLLQDVIEQMKIKSLSKEIDILYKSDLTQIEILGDYDRLQQVFINVLHNAIKYSNPGAIIDVVSTSDEEWVHISIRDYGIGISESDQKKIFSAFYRVEEDRSRNEGEGGAGLGLYLVRQIVEKHAGRIDIASILGEGTNIIITLPVLTKIIQEDIQHEK